MSIVGESRAHQATEVAANLQAARGLSGGSATYRLHEDERGH